jgi:hypothetical protein
MDVFNNFANDVGKLYKEFLNRPKDGRGKCAISANVGNKRRAFSYIGGLRNDALLPPTQSGWITCSWSKRTFGRSTPCARGPFLKISQTILPRRRRNGISRHSLRESRTKRRREKKKKRKMAEPDKSGFFHPFMMTRIQKLRTNY